MGQLVGHRNNERIKNREGGPRPGAKVNNKSKEDMARNVIMVKTFSTFDG